MCIQMTSFGRFFDLISVSIMILWPGQGFIVSVVKFVWNRFSLRLFILLAFTFWLRDLAVFLVKLCSEVVYCWHDLFYFQESSTYLKVNHITMWGSVLEWVWLAFMSVNWCIVKPSLDFVKPCVIKLRYVTISKRWKLWFIPHPKYHIWLQKDTSWRGIYISFK